MTDRTWGLNFVITQAGEGTSITAEVVGVTSQMEKAGVIEMVASYVQLLRDDMELVDEVVPGG